MMKDLIERPVVWYEISQCLGGIDRGGEGGIVLQKRESVKEKKFTLRSQRHVYSCDFATYVVQVLCLKLPGSCNFS